SAVGLAQADLATGQFVRVNRRFCEITGYSETELQSKTFHDLIHPQDRDRNSTLVDPVMRGEADWWEIEQRYIRANGAAIWVHVAGRLVTDANNRPYRTIASIVDITDRKRAEASLYQANETLEDRVRERTR